MYSDIKSVQILVSLLKQHNIRRVVLSPGNRNVPIAHSLEVDPFFETYSIVDERSAGFFGIGLIQRYREPVAICCTSGTAVCNYYSAVTEAFYQKLPLLVISADRNPYYLNQDEEQMLPQTDGFEKVTRKIVQLPMIKDEVDEYTCGRMINEAILELNHHGGAPVQINIPIEKGLSVFNTTELPKVKKIKRHYLYDDWTSYAEQLKNKRVLVLYGQSPSLTDEDIRIVEEFSSMYGAIIAVDPLSNLHCKGAVSTFSLSRVTSAESFKSTLLPEIVITLNSGYLSYVRSHLKSCKGMFDHWCVNADGSLQDPLFSIKEVFEASPIEFLKKMVKTGSKAQVDSAYLELWQSKTAGIDFNNIELPYCNFYAVRELVNALPKGSAFHIANSTSVRLVSHFDLDPSIEVYCNRGANGIDGSASAYMGMACNNDKKAFLLIGDLSFFYDMNSLWNNYISPNMRIILSNNSGATLFHYTVGIKNVSTLDQNIAAGHDATAKGWVESRGFEYIAVRNEQDLSAALIRMNEATERPIFIEVFTDKEQDAQVLKKSYAQFEEKESSVKNILKTILRGKNV
ncbi:MAG: 2-succinyl-5-enolpyruvyl-6-hydroxy-3-cyclohexene-1-carboxylic-acid synthase [Ruminococcaceae bacterium]|nr:2-succinyl-5-enolpyruvyl-6-hydroxy-3-cyclohexene-1-carboxylic-acid synthase [Oscillospiraceae bacterium]